MSVRYKETPNDYYELLEVDKTASRSDIKLAFRKKAREYHPDRCPRFDAADKFGEMMIAYNTLYDPEKRKVYNTKLRADLYEKEVGKSAKRAITFSTFDFDGLPDILNTLREVGVLVICSTLVILYLFSL